MVRLGKGQAILGGSSNEGYHSKIYSMTCSNRNCIILLLNREHSVPKENFVAISISDTITGCITKGKNYFQKTSKFSLLTPDLVKKPPPLLQITPNFLVFYGLSQSTTLKKKDMVFFRVGPKSGTI